MGVDTTVYLMYGVRLVTKPIMETKTKYNEDTGKPYETAVSAGYQEYFLEADSGNKVPLDGWVYPEGTDDDTLYNEALTPCTNFFGCRLAVVDTLDVSHESVELSQKFEDEIEDKWHKTCNRWLTQDTAEIVYPNGRLMVAVSKY